jgi:hypothetical protein
MNCRPELMGKLVTEGAWDSLLWNETVTWAFLLLIRERMARAGGRQTWAQFAAHNEDLLNRKDNVLKKYYRGETLSSDLARRAFLLPDKAANDPG